MTTANVTFGQQVKNYLSLIKFSHTVFALPFAMIGFCMAVVKDGYSFSWDLFCKSAAVYGICPYFGHGFQPLSGSQV